MLVLQPKPTFKAVVSFPIPGGVEGKLTVIFRHKGKKELKAFFEGLGAAEASDDAVKTDADALMELIEGWEGVDEKFSKENLETLLDSYPTSALALYETYRQEMLEGRVKN